jgi:hypothetical protein
LRIPLWRIPPLSQNKPLIWAVAAGLMVVQSPELQERLQAAHDMFSLLEEQFPAMLETLEQERKARLKV